MIGKTDEKEKTKKERILILISWIIALRKIPAIAHIFKISGDILGQTFEHSLLEWCIRHGFPAYAIEPTEFALIAILYIFLGKWILEFSIEVFQTIKIKIQEIMSERNKTKRRYKRKTPEE